MSVEFRPVNAREFGFATNGKTATTAHTRTVNHNGVHTYYGFYAVFFGKTAYEFHHYNRSDRDYFIVLFATFNKVFKRVGYKTFSASRAVVAHKNVFVADSLKLVF